LAIAPNTSVLSYFLLESEKLGAQVRRFTSPSEHPFSDPALLPKPLLPELDYPVTVRPNGINHNAQVMHFYLATVLPSICDEGDDENYGSSAMADVAALQLLSKRSVHFL
jgi:chorismate mutase